MLFAGFVYAWSILSAPIAADFPQWSNAQLSLTFTLCMAFFCLGGMAAGFLSKRIPVRVNVMLSAALFLVGFFLTSRAGSLPMLYVSYGVLCGTASGFSYNSVMNLVPRWFPDRPGLISGTMLMGFGASSMVIGSVFTAVTPDVGGAWRGTLLALGVLMAAVIFAGSFCFVPPAPGEVPAAGKASTGGGGENLTPAQMLRRVSFWVFFLWTVAVSAVGLVVIAQAGALARAAAPSLDAGAVSLAVGLISVCNGLGRVLFGGLFDRLGRRIVMPLVVACAALGAVSLWLSVTVGSPALLVVGFVFAGLGYGGGPTMIASVTKEFYGERDYPVNFSIVNLNLLIAPLSSTAAGAILDAAGSFSPVFILLFALLAVALVCSLCLHKA